MTGRDTYQSVETICQHTSRMVSDFARSTSLPSRSFLLEGESSRSIDRVLAKWGIFAPKILAEEIEPTLGIINWHISIMLCKVSRVGFAKHSEAASASLAIEAQLWTSDCLSLVKSEPKGEKYAESVNRVAMSARWAEFEFWRLSMLNCRSSNYFLTVGAWGMWYIQLTSRK
jgi:hypothetical protein